MMVRINLLPVAKRQVAAAGGGQLWGVIYLLCAFAWGVVLFLVYLSFNGELEEQRARNGEIEAQIEKARKQSANIGEVEAQLARSKQLEEVVNGLQKARLGPTRLLMELSHILSAGRGPTADPDKIEQLRRSNPLAAFNPGWDIRRLWLTSFSETNQQCKISGFGKTNEDIAEFLRRLALSDVFEKVTLQSTSSSKDKDTDLPIVSFELSCEVKY
jgi:type IV pilus assembly protein PilN